MGSVWKKKSNKMNKKMNSIRTILVDKLLTEKYWVLFWWKNKVNSKSYEREFDIEKFEPKLEQFKFCFKNIS